ncbi:MULTISPECIES: thioredoxin [Prosthecochloris]|uniref:Thioredoxin n=1 Tax=Prosthecochloris vibrioformis TaxID=1098 RepID=A0A5C4S199_PROVB|nr:MULTISPECIES: thioredoxin [Prosthecochloris]ANT65002.1 Thioredoxin [Prosthecochloris sp. CIB 2401]TNJ36928.1 thioredoxin [Prosthecochloris vibrioformis]
MTEHDATIDFSRDVLQKSSVLPVLVDFWAPWCAPCRMLAPAIEAVARRFEGRVELVKVNTEEHPDSARQYGVQGIPNVKLFVQGRVVDEFTGVLPEQDIAAWLEKALPSPYADDVLHAAELLQEGKSARALELLEEVLLHEPGNQDAGVMLMKLKLFSDPAEAERLAGMFEGNSELFDLCGAVRTLAGVLGRSEPDVPDGTLREIYIAAVNHLRNQEFDQALDMFIAVLKEDRFYDDDGSRKNCIAMFRFLGEEHPVTLRHRRAFDRSF